MACVLVRMARAIIIPAVANHSKDIEESFPLWAGVIALVIVVFALIRFRELSLAEQKKYVMPKEDPDDFHNWIA